MAGTAPKSTDPDSQSPDPRGKVIGAVLGAIFALLCLSAIGASAAIAASGDDDPGSDHSEEGDHADEGDDH